MINETRVAELRELFRSQHGQTLGDLLFDADMRKGDEWIAYVAKLRAERQAIQKRLDAAATSDESTVLAPLRKAANDALLAHMAASAELEGARIECEAKGAQLRNQIDALTRKMAEPMWPMPTQWKSIDAPQPDAREAAAAAATPMQVGGGWIDNKAINPGMPVDLGPMNAKAN